jgi:hypothetical protein
MSETGILRLVAGFEDLTLPKAAFDHAAHLTVAAYFIEVSGEAAAMEKMRTGLQRFASHHGAATLYHETITRFWVRRVAAACAEMPEAGLAHKCAHAVRTLGRKELLFEHYRRETVLSESARRAWVEPDRKPLP